MHFSEALVKKMALRAEACPDAATRAKKAPAAHGLPLLHARLRLPLSCLCISITVVDDDDVDVLSAVKQTANTNSYTNMNTCAAAGLDAATGADR